ncbi:MAG: hypothetical protein RLZZ381_1212 [Cyanobacteriota bacterium]|jgi:hypothetical protein
MSKNIGEHPLPPDNFSEKRLLSKKYFKPWYRLNPAGFDSAIYFDRSGKGRFDSPESELGILYSAENVGGAFIETFGRNLGIRTVSQIALQQRNLFKITSDRPLMIVNLWGANLSKLGMDARVSSGSYEVARAWVNAIYQHPQKVDGISYHSRHDDTEVCFGLFDRSGNILREENLGNLVDSNPKLLAEILKHYDYSLI